MERGIERRHRDREREGATEKVGERERENEVETKSTRGRERERERDEKSHKNDKGTNAHHTLTRDESQKLRGRARDSKLEHRQNDAIREKKNRQTKRPTTRRDSS